MSLRVILDHTQAGFLLVHDRNFHSVAGDDGCSIDFIGFDIAGRRCDLLDAISARLDLGENSSTGTYLVKEVATDSSHIINSTPQQIELEGSDGILELIFFNDQKPGIHLVKLDSTTLEPLPNARFRIELVGGTFSKEYTTDANGEIDLTDLSLVPSR